ncbi:MAG: hypothetical protein F2534_20650 [Actinobacteria bacterium]|uniref:Unannotated protein n=1 Tax=freshwater metagenome TaxID=449393 RepID=A0A6J6G7I4_9ZZZZ|nr:hypothetical protein [Actinomycetota bacterium]
MDSSNFAAAFGEPWRDRTVERITVRGVAGAVEQLADDQFEFWVPSATSDAYAVVAVRGLDREAAVAAVEELDDSTGVLQPLADFSLTERVAGSPPSAALDAYAQLTYDFEKGPWVATWLQPADATSVEGTLRWPAAAERWFRASR